MKKLISAMVLTAASITAQAAEVQVALSVNHIWGQTWEDDQQVKHEYNEDNRFVSVWREDGFGGALFVNSYGKTSVLFGRKGEKQMSCGALNRLGVQCTWGLLFGVASGYEDAVSSGILPVLAPFWTVKYKASSLGVGIYSAQAVVSTFGIKF